MEKIECDINIDGLPISKSSKSQVWPILGRFNINVFVIGIYWGNSKPNVVSDYFKPFVQETKELYENGITVNGQKILVTIRSFICDSPARAFIKGIKAHNAYFGCDRCHVEGDYSHEFHRMYFLETKCTLRSDESFRLREQLEHHLCTSSLEELPVNMISDFPLDYLHLICVGVTKKMLSIWLGTIVTESKRIKFCSNDITTISTHLLNARKTQPVEFNRQPRGLDVFRFWKATEFRTFLLYLGPVVLYNALPYDAYQHFLLLHCAISICIYQRHLKYLCVAKKMLTDFVSDFGNIYGNSFMSYNIHSLIHLADDCLKFGPLEYFSSFPFESKLGTVKTQIRTGKNPLEQIANRITEQTSTKKKEFYWTKYPVLKKV